MTNTSIANLVGASPAASVVNPCANKAPHSQPHSRNIAGEGSQASFSGKQPAEDIKRALHAPKRARGFTLLEVLVVVAIVAVMSAALLLSAAGSGAERRVEDEATRLVRILQLVCDQSVIEARFIGFGVGSRTYAGYDFTDAGWKLIVGNQPLGVYSLPDGIVLTVPDSEQPLVATVPEKPQFLCSPTGELGNLALDVGVAGQTPQRRVRLDEGGQPRSVAATDISR